MATDLLMANHFDFGNVMGNDPVLGSDFAFEPPEDVEFGSPQIHVSPSAETIDAILRSIQPQAERIEFFTAGIRQLYDSPDEAHYEMLLSAASTLMQTVEEEQRALEDLMDRYLLSPKELHFVNMLQVELHVQHTQLEIYCVEIEHVRKNEKAPPLLSLVILNQPFPSVIRQKKKIEGEELTVKLLAGATVRIESISPISCIVGGLQDTTAADKQMVTSHVQAMDPDSLVAKFPLDFVEGTRKTVAFVNFRAQVELVQLRAQAESVSVESANSRCFVVMTNQKQWEDCEKLLACMDAFGDAQSVTWQRFANVLQRHFLLATKQDFANPQRPLSTYDFAYINSQYFGERSSIHVSEFESFWKWYGKTLQVLRYQRHICHMWINGLVYGYMSREDVIAALTDQAPGTFVIRFSERNHGQFAVAYIHSDNTIHHYLVKPTDTAGAKITLADFLMNVPQLSHLHKFEVSENAPIFTRILKSNALESLCSRTPGLHEQGSGGYDHLIG